MFRWSGCRTSSKGDAAMSPHAWVAAVLAGAVALAVAASGCAPQEPSKAEPQVFVNKVKGFTIAFPGDWKTWEGGRGTDVEGYPPDQIDPNVPRDMVFVYAENLPDVLTADEYARVKSEQGQKGLPEYKEFESKTVDLGGKPARRVIYSTVVAETPMKSLAYFLVREKRGYMIIGTADTARFDVRVPDFERIAATFKLTP
jgi:hypothetical protein